jgi:osmotically-inducible protein OsmY
MKHAMTVKLLVAGVCALGAAAVAQPDNGSAAPMNQDPPSSQIAPAESGSNPSGYGNEAAAPNRTMTSAEKKQSLSNIKKAIRDADKNSARPASEQSIGAETGSMDAKHGVQHLKVFRRGDQVVLRGTVRSQEEKDKVGSTAESAAPGEQIVNELEVK